MAFDMGEIKEKIEELTAKLSKDADLSKLFKENPIKAVEKALGVDLPDEAVEKIIDGVKAKLSIDSAKDFLGKLKDKF